MDHETHPKLFSIASAVARSLSVDGEKYRAKKAVNYYGVSIVGGKPGDPPLELYLFCNDLRRDDTDLQSQKISISGSYPADHTNYRYAPREPITIKVSANRPAKDIAADIRRRLLEHVKYHTVEAHKWVEARLREHKARQKVIRFLAAAGDGVVNVENARDSIYRASRSHYQNGAGASWSATATYTGSVNLEIHALNPKLAGKILRLLTKSTQEA